MTGWKYRFTCYNCGHSRTKTLKGGIDDIRLALKKLKSESSCLECYSSVGEWKRVGG